MRQRALPNGPSEGAVAVFLGECLGVRLVKRGKDDDHLCFELLVEDDGTWFIEPTGPSTFWLDELMSCLESARDWCKRNAVSDEDGWRLP